MKNSPRLIIITYNVYDIFWPFLVYSQTDLVPLSGTGAVTYHLKRYHKDAWEEYIKSRTTAQEKTSAAKKELEDSCEMANASVRFFDTRTSGGRLPFLSKVRLSECPSFLLEATPSVH